MHGRINPIANAAALLACVACLSGCGPEREAEVETGTTEVEVSTSLPENVVSDAQLKAAAANAAAAATTATANVTAVEPTNTTP